MPLITPQFDITQTEECIVINIRLPYVKVSKSEYFIEGYAFHFYLKPYSLKLTFENELKEAELPQKCVYDPLTYILSVHILKKVPGQNFSNLNMISLLMSKGDNKKSKKVPKKLPLIQVIDSQDNPDAPEEETKEAPTNIKQIEQLMKKYHYGFNNSYFDIFDNFEEELYEIAILNPQFIPIEERKRQLSLQTTQDFKVEDYVYDFLENEEIDEILKWEIEFILKPPQSDTTKEAVKLQFSNEEIKVLQNLPKKEYLLNNEAEFESMCQILDIIFSQIYEMIVMQGDFGCESAITINRISSTLSAFTIDTTIKQVLCTCFERSLCYPLYRSFEIAEKALNSVKYVFLSGKLQILKLLIQLKSLFQKSEPRYLLNLVFIDDLLLFIQQVSEEKYNDFMGMLQTVEIIKSDLRFNLQAIEKEGLLEMISYQSLEEQKDNN